MYWWNFTWNFIACTTVVHVKHLSIAFIDKIYTGDTISHVHIENSLWILNEFDKNSKPRLCLLRRRGRQSSRGVPTYNFAKTFQKQRMKLKTFWAVGGRPLTSATALSYSTSAHWILFLKPATVLSKWQCKCENYASHRNEILLFLIFFLILPSYVVHMYQEGKKLSQSRSSL